VISQVVSAGMDNSIVSGSDMSYSHIIVGSVNFCNSGGLSIGFVDS
jgi:hypothetical protein